MNLWHDLDPGTKNSMTVVVEIPKWSKNKYEIDKETGMIKLDRAMRTSQDYPFDYGFVPQTLWEDNDALDVVLLTTYPLHPGILVKARPVAVVRMIDSGEGDDKVVAVPEEDPRWDKVKDLKDINPHTIKEMIHFFESYKMIDKKKIEIKGIRGAKEAKEAFEKGRALYKEKVLG